MGELLISFLEEDGYLRTPLETVRDRAVVIEGDPSGETGRMTAQGPVFGERPTVERLERALRALQLFLEPAGVGARSAAECLLLQLDAKEADVAEMGWPLQTIAHARTIVADHLEDLKQNRLPRLSEKTGLSMEQIREALGLLKRLSLSPARGMVDDAPRAIVPDAIVEYDADQDRYIAYLNETQIPALRINQEYARLGRDKAMEKKDREFVRTSVGNAQWLIDAVNQRRTTLLRVVEKVVEAQRDYFDYGPQALKPLPMTLVAEQLGIHVATVSRAVHEKYIATPRGTVPLRKMFSGGLQTKAAAPAGLKQDAAGEEGGEAGQEMAWEAVKAALREVIEGEDRKRPLSDEALVRELKKRGIEIARRTVAKYRDQLGIPTARLRKVF